MFKFTSSPKFRWLAIMLILAGTHWQLWQLGAKSVVKHSFALSEHLSREFLIALNQKDVGRLEELMGNDCDLSHSSYSKGERDPRYVKYSSLAGRDLLLLLDQDATSPWKRNHVSGEVVLGFSGDFLRENMQSLTASYSADRSGSRVTIDVSFERTGGQYQDFLGRRINTYHIAYITLDEFQNGWYGHDED